MAAHIAGQHLAVNRYLGRGTDRNLSELHRFVQHFQPDAVFPLIEGKSKGHAVIAHLVPEGDGFPSEQFLLPGFDLVPKVVQLGRCFIGKATVKGNVAAFHILVFPVDPDRTLNGSIRPGKRPVIQPYLIQTCLGDIYRPFYVGD